MSGVAVLTFEIRGNILGTGLFTESKLKVRAPKRDRNLILIACKAALIGFLEPGDIEMQANLLANALVSMQLSPIKSTEINHVTYSNVSFRVLAREA